MDWCVHYVPDALPNHMADIHTHGLRKAYNHPEIQRTISLCPEAAHVILTDIVEHIKEGNRPELNKPLTGLPIGDYSHMFVQVKGADLIRLILPDKYNRLQRRRTGSQCWTCSIAPLLRTRRSCPWMQSEPQSNPAIGQPVKRWHEVHELQANAHAHTYGSLSTAHTRG